MGVLPAGISVYHLGDDWGGQKSFWSDPLELELQPIVGAWSWTWIL